MISVMTISWIEYSENGNDTIYILIRIISSLLFDQLHYEFISFG